MKKIIRKIIQWFCHHKWEAVSADGLSVDYQCKKCGAYRTEDRPRPKENWN